MAAAAVSAVGGLGGCATTAPEPGPEQVVTPEPVELPAYAEIAAAQNTRSGMLDRLWGAATAIVTYQDQDGQVRTEQAEGYLQLIQPSSVALMLGKQITSEIYFYLGCNDEHYWWLDRLDPERKVAYIGTHELATPERAAKFGAPVHPLDLLDLLGITQIPEPVEAAQTAATGTGGGDEREEDPTLPDGARLGWAPDGEHIVVDVPGRFGTRRMWFDPENLMPRRVEILDDRGRIVVYSTLAADAVVEVRGDSRQRPLMSEQVEVWIPGTQISIRLRLSRLENKRSRQSTAPFDLEGVLRAYPVDRREDLDALEVEAEPASPGAPAGVREPDRRLRVSPGGTPARDG